MSITKTQELGQKLDGSLSVFLFNEDSLLFSCGSLTLILSFLNIMDRLLLSAFTAPAPAETNNEDDQ